MRLRVDSCDATNVDTNIGMECVVKILRKFLNDESGATAIEYALIAAGIGLVIITGVNALGTKINGKFNTINSKL